MAGSEIRESHREGDTRVQDPYCIRCQPQVTGACDRPAAAGRPHAGNRGERRHRQPAGADRRRSDRLGREFPCRAGGLCRRPDRAGRGRDRRDRAAPHRADGGPDAELDLPPFLTPDPGLNSGLMIAEVTSAALMSENKHLATAGDRFSTPTSANQEDHVSMAAHGARRLRRMNANLNRSSGSRRFAPRKGSNSARR
jgi:histidine ammonia-lyase